MIESKGIAMRNALQNKRSVPVSGRNLWILDVAVFRRSLRRREESGRHPQ
jgi:hypothetical protein